MSYYEEQMDNLDIADPIYKRPYGHSKLWRTQDGRYLDPEDFDNNHLLNTIKYIERLQAEDPGEAGYCPGDSDGAYWAGVCEDRHNDNVRKLLEDAHNALTKEARKRGLLVI